MRRLLPIEATGTRAFVDALQRAWDDGDAVLPIDPRLPRVAVERLLVAMRVDDEVADGDALVIATSGTTGEPKGAVLTHDALAASARATSARLDVDPERDTWLACLPLAHIGGLSVVIRALLTETPLIVHDGFVASDVDAAARDEGATLVSLVGTAVRRLPVAAAFRTIVVGGDAPPPSLPANAVTTYGMTETGSGVVYDGTPLDGVEVRVDDDGALSVRGPMLFRSYRDGTDPKDADGWFPTGDSGTWDDVGRLVLHGRTADLIVTGGEKVWPGAVERIVAALPGVAAVAVRGDPDPEWGQRVVAIVVPTDAGAPPTLAALRAAVKDELGAWAAPKEIEIVDDLPRTTLGKVRRRGW